MTDLSVIIVNWNVRQLLCDCLLSLTGGADRDSPPPGVPEIIVVDCASSDGSPDMVRDRFPQVKLIAHDQNLGYARGNNLGISQASGRYFLILNPDTQLEGNALQQMVQHMEDNPDWGAVGPGLVYGDGSPQPSRRRFPTLSTAFWESTLLDQWFPDNRFARHYHMRDEAPESDNSAQAVDWLVGAALMIRRQAWQEVGPLDESFFMYFEELDWCRRCQEADWQIRYLPTAQVMHHEGKSSEQVMAARTVRFQRSKIRYFNKYYGQLWGWIIRAFLLASFGVQLAEESVKWLVGHRRSLRRQRMAAYWQVLKSGLSPIAE